MCVRMILTTIWKSNKKGEERCSLTMGQEKVSTFSFDDSSLAIFVHSGCRYCFQLLAECLCNCSMHSPPKEFIPLHNCPIIANIKTLNKEIVRAQWVIEVCNMVMQMAWFRKPINERFRCQLDTTGKTAPWRLHALLDYPKSDLLSDRTRIELLVTTQGIGKVCVIESKFYTTGNIFILNGIYWIKETEATRTLKCL